MNRERALKVVLVLVGMIFLLGVYPRQCHHRVTGNAREQGRSSRGTASPWFRCSTAKSQSTKTENPGNLQDTISDDNYWQWLVSS